MQARCVRLVIHSGEPRKLFPLVVPALLILVLASCDNGTPQPPPPTNTAVSQEVVLEGNGSQDSAPFSMEGGRYVLDWKVLNPNPQKGSLGCLGHGTVRPVGDATSELTTFDLRAEDTQPSAASSAYVDNPTPGQYYIRTDFVFGCQWTITVHRP